MKVSCFNLGVKLFCIQLYLQYKVKMITETLMQTNSEFLASFVWKNINATAPETANAPAVSKSVAPLNCFSLGRATLT